MMASFGHDGNIMDYNSTSSSLHPPTTYAMPITASFLPFSPSPTSAPPAPSARTTATTDTTHCLVSNDDDNEHHDNLQSPDHLDGDLKLAKKADLEIG